MKLLSFISYLCLALASISTAVIVQSSDGTDIFAEAVGNPRNPPIVFVHGLTVSALVFYELFKDPRLLDHFYLATDEAASPIPQRAMYASNLFADDFAAVLRTFHVRAPLFVGWSYGGTVLSDIFTNLPPGTISGIVGVAAIPFLGLPVVDDPQSASILGGIIVTDDVAVGVGARITFIDMLFNDAATVPTHILWSWYGSAVIQFPQVSILLVSRTQDPTALYVAGARGFPYLSIFGTADQVVANDNVTAEIAPHFTNLKVQRIQGGSHAVFFDNQTAFIEALVPFANRILQGR